MKKFLLFGFVLLIAAGGFAVYGIYQRRNADNSPAIQNQQESDPVSALAEQSELTYSGWIPDWGSGVGLESMKTNSALLTGVSPVWYEINPNGSLINKRPTIADEIQSYSREQELEFIPAIAMFDHELFSQVLQNSENLQRHVDAIVAEVDKYDYDGIDLDYESTKLVDKDAYFTLLQKLAQALHARDKKLIVTVLPKWGDNIAYPSLPETRQVQGWSEIAKYADEIRIMAYDYTYSASAFPGPIAPLEWVRQILDYAITEIPPSKIVLGVHLYAYQWAYQVNDSESEHAFEPNIEENPISEQSRASSHTYQTVKQILAENEGSHFNFDGEKIFQYRKPHSQTGELEDRVLVYIDQEGIVANQELAQTYGIKGLVFWRLGNEADLLLGLKN